MAYTTIDDPGLYFNTLTWTGDDADSRDITGVGFQPDWVWGKRRDDAAGHNLLDVVRGAGENGELASSTSGIEGSNAQDRFGFLSAFLSDGFRVEDGSEASGDKAYWNQNSATYVAWNWKAGGTASSNTDGSITSSVSANTTAGFSIVTYTGTGSAATVGHGLGAVPKMFWTKRRDNNESWGVYHHTQGAGKFLRLESTNAVDTSSTLWNNTTPTSSVFSIAVGGIANTSSGTYVAYCFAEKKGFSKFGKYTGNGNANGTFVYTGFRPAWVMMKASTASEHWNIHDNKRDPINVCDAGLKANESNAEEDADRLDFVSNGFKHRSSSGGYNSSNTFIYMAFAESPFVNSNGIPNNAR